MYDDFDFFNVPSRLGSLLNSPIHQSNKENEDPMGFLNISTPVLPLSIASPPQVKCKTCGMEADLESMITIFNMDWFCSRRCIYNSIYGFLLSMAQFIKRPYIHLDDMALAAFEDRYRWKKFVSKAKKFLDDDKDKLTSLKMLFKQCKNFHELYHTLKYKAKSMKEFLGDSWKAKPHLREICIYSHSIPHIHNRY